MPRRFLDRRRSAAVLAALVAAMLVAAAPSGPERAPGRPGAHGPPTACEHPHPCGDEWPEGLTGPFELEEVEYTFIEQANGVELETWIGHPKLPPGVRAPVILVASVYFGSCSAVLVACFGTPSEPGWWQDPPSSGPLGGPESTVFTGLSALQLVQVGYAVAHVNLPGSGHSGGCLDDGGPSQVEAVGEVVDWLASREWSNGRVGMAGISHGSQTAFGGLASGTQNLKTVAVSGTVTDAYLFFTTPQGEVNAQVARKTGVGFAEYSLHPNPFAPERAPGTLGVTDQRLCPEFVESRSHEAVFGHLDDRDEVFWQDHSHVDGLARTRAAVLHLEGFGEIWAHQFQGHRTHEMLQHAPNHFVMGQWAHDWPMESYRDEGGYAGAPLDRIPPPERWGHSFDQLYLDWFDYWLKGVGPVPEELGTVDYQDDAGWWHESTAWPPAEATERALFLDGNGLAAVGAPGERAYDSSTYAAELSRVDQSDSFALENAYTPNLGWRVGLCPILPDGVTSTIGFLSEPVDKPVTVAGNPYAVLNLRSSMPAGIVHVDLQVLGPDFACDERGNPTDVQRLTGFSGGADLRFHTGNFVAEPFPVDEVVPVRIDLPNMAFRLDPGERLAMTVGVGAGPVRYQSDNYTQAVITIASGDDRDASRLVVPVVEGVLGAPEKGDPPPSPLPVIPDVE